VGWDDVPARLKQGWTQPSRVGWAHVPARLKQGWTQPSRVGEGKNHDWLLCMSTVTS